MKKVLISAAVLLLLLCIGSACADTLRIPEGTEVIVPNESNGLSDLMEIMAERGPMGGF